jgi:hypothetical protein
MIKPGLLASSGAVILALLMGTFCCEASEAASSCSADERVALKQARSLLAEAQFADQLWLGGRTTDTFNSGLRKQAADELRSMQASLSENSAAISATNAGEMALLNNKNRALPDFSAEIKVLGQAVQDCE